MIPGIEKLPGHIHHHGDPVPPRPPLACAWPVLALANLLWAGNIVLARGLAGAVPPVALAYWRWTGEFLVAPPFAWTRLHREAPLLRRHWRMMLLLSATGIASYNTLSYIALTKTTALNVLLLQSAAPLVILIWAFLLFGERRPGSHWATSRCSRPSPPICFLTAGLSWSGPVPPASPCT